MKILNKNCHNINKFYFRRCKKRRALQLIIIKTKISSFKRLLVGKIRQIIFIKILIKKINKKEFLKENTLEKMLTPIEIFTIRKVI